MQQSGCMMTSTKRPPVKWLRDFFFFLNGSESQSEYEQWTVSRFRFLVQPKIEKPKHLDCHLVVSCGIGHKFYLLCNRWHMDEISFSSKIIFCHYHTDPFSNFNIWFATAQTLNVQDGRIRFGFTSGWWDEWSQCAALRWRIYSQTASAALSAVHFNYQLSIKTFCSFSGSSTDSRCLTPTSGHLTAYRGRYNWKPGHRGSPHLPGFYLFPFCSPPPQFFSNSDTTAGESGVHRM